MLEKPNLPEAAISAALEEHYDLALQSLTFLPIGNDARAWVYRVQTAGQAHFLKLRQGMPKRAALHVPRYLRGQGIASVVAPFATRSPGLYAALDGFSLILYPWIEGSSAWGRPLSAQQWTEWGAAMRAVHNSKVTAELAELVPRETFDGKYAVALERIQHLINAGNHQHGIARAMAHAWRSKQPQIDQARERYRSLCREFGAALPDCVLCHADIHKANIIIDQRQAVHIVDWDEAIIAPKERDLMFFAADGHPPEASDAFSRGYGRLNADLVGLAYYRYDWLLQEFCDNGERVFLADALGEREKQHALDEFKRLFAEGDVFDLAVQAYRQIP